jgi:hypothetical protein
MPKRVQLSRAKGFKLPFRTVKVDRTTRFGNPYRIGESVDMKQVRKWGWNLSPEGRKHVCADAAEAVAKFSHALFWDVAIHDFVRNELAGKDLACWCPLDQPCHADALLRIANTDAGEVRAAQDFIDDKIMTEAEAVMQMPTR